MSGSDRRIRVVGAATAGKVSVARFAALPDLPDPKLHEQRALGMVRDDKAVVQRQRYGRAEPSRPWLLTGAHPSRKAERVTFSGRLEESQTGKYVLLLSDGSGSGALQMLPCHEWYSFRKVAAAQLHAADDEALREAEKKMTARYTKSDAFKAKCASAANDEAADDDDDPTGRSRPRRSQLADEDATGRPRLQLGDNDSDNADVKEDAGNAEEDVYDGAGNDETDWVNAGLGQGDDADGDEAKGEGLDVSDADGFSDDEGADGRMGEEGAEEANTWLGGNDGSKLGMDTDAAGQAADTIYQEVEGTDDESDDEDDDDDDDDDDNDDNDDGGMLADSGGAISGAGASRAGGPGKRERASADSPAQGAGASAVALSKRARVLGGGAKRSFLAEADLVQMLREWGNPPPTVQEFMSKLYKEIGPASGEGQAVIFGLIDKIAMQIKHDGKDVLVLRG
jgi:hypothetical protein